MSDAPERIWANPITTDRGALIEGEWYDACGGEYMVPVEYVRADIHADLTAERDKLRDALTVIRNGKFPACPFDGPNCTVAPDEPCPVCGDENTLIGDSNCTAIGASGIARAALGETP